MGTMSGDITEINWHDPARTVVMEVKATAVKYFSPNNICQLFFVIAE
jgi:hypothetical protein